MTSWYANLAGPRATAELPFLVCGLAVAYVAGVAQSAKGRRAGAEGSEEATGSRSGGAQGGERERSSEAGHGDWAAEGNRQKEGLFLPQPLTCGGGLGGGDLEARPHLHFSPMTRHPQRHMGWGSCIIWGTSPNPLKWRHLWHVFLRTTHLPTHPPRSPCRYTEAPAQLRDGALTLPRTPGGLAFLVSFSLGGLRGGGGGE